MFLPDCRGLSSLRHVPLYEEGLNVVVSAQHPLARHRRLVSLAELHDLEWIVPTRDSATTARCPSSFANNSWPCPSM